MTSLAQQLQKLAIPQASATILGRERRNKSLLFDPKEAGNTDRDTFHAIGVNGLMELQTIDPHFQEFEQTLFDEASKALERSVQTKDVNEKLDKKIHTFLLRLSPYFTLKPAQKALEWLVYRFYIYEYNIDDLMMCILPYHTTKIFVRAVQLLDLKEETNRWHWLHAIQEPGVPVARSTVLTHCHKDAGFTQFVCKLVPAMIKAHENVASSVKKKQALQSAFSFYASTIIGAIASASPVDGHFLDVLIPYLMKGLKSSLEEYQAASYMIVSYLCSKVILSQEFLNPVVDRICKYTKPSLETEALSCLAVVCQTQNFSKFPEKSFRNLCKFPQLPATLQRLSYSSGVSPIVNCIMQQLILCCFQETEDDINDDSLDYQKLLKQMISEISLDPKQAESLARFLIRQFVNESRGESCPGNINVIVKFLERKYPQEMDVAMQSYSAEVIDLSEQACLQRFAQMTVNGATHMVIPESETSLVLSLNHANPDVRAAAVGHLHKLTTAGKLSPQFLNSALSQRIQDDDKKVLYAVLQMSDFFVGTLASKEVIDNFERILGKWRRKGSDLWVKIAERILQILTSRGFYSESDGAMNRCLVLILPYLFPTTAERSDREEKIFNLLAASDLAKSHPVIKGLASVKWISDVYEMTELVFELITKNLCKMTKRTRIEHIESLLIYHDHHLLEAYKLILSIILGQVMAGLEDAAQKLEVAQHIFDLLKVDMMKMVCRETVFKKTIDENKSGGGSVSHLQHQLAHLLVTKRRHQSASVMSCDFAQGTLFSAIKIVKEVKAPKEIGAQVWLNLSPNVATPQDRYLLLILSLTDLAIQGTASGNLSKGRLTFKQLLEQILQHHLMSLTSFLKFFSLIWTNHLLVKSDRAVTFSSQVLAFSLHVAVIRLTAAEPAGIMQTLAADESGILPLVILLSHSLPPIREQAISCLTVIRNCLDSESSLYLMLKSILKRSSEIIADGNYVPRVFKNMFQNIGGDSDAAKSKGDSQKHKEENLMRFLNSDFPEHIQMALLKQLAMVDNKYLLSSLLHSYSKLLDSASVNQKTSVYHMTCMIDILRRFTPAVADMVEDDLSEELLLKSLSFEGELCPGMNSVQAYALDQITPEFFEALPAFQTQQRLIGKLIDLHVSSTNPHICRNISGVLRKLPLQAKHILFELHQADPSTQVKSLQQARRARRSKKLRREQVDNPVSAQEWKRITFVLEHLQQRKIHRMQNAAEVVPVLFSLLARSQEVPVDAKDMEYIKQLVLTLIHGICKAAMATDDQSVELNEQQFNVELVVQCIRTSDNPHTHNQAMLLLSLAAQLFPEQVLHNIMSIFTFMGANILHRDDNHSFEVISRTLRTVIPALLALNSSSQKALSAGVEGNVLMIIRVFVDAFPHIPDHRKLPLFTQLINTIGEEFYLWRCVVLLIESFVVKGVAALYPDEDITDTKNPGRSEGFWLEVCHTYPASIQILTLGEMVKYLATLPEDKTDEGVSSSPSRRSTRSQTSAGNFLFDVNRHSGRHLRHFKFTAVGFVSHLLASEKFVAQVASCSDEERESLKELYQRLLEESLAFIHSIAHSVEDNADNVTAKFWRALLHRGYDILDKVNALLPAQVFIRVVSGLLGNQLVTVRRKAMDLLNNMLTQYKEPFTEEETELLLSMVTDLVKVAKPTKSRTKPPEVELNRQTALYSLKLLCKILGPDHPKDFLVVMETTLDVIKEEDSTQLSSSALLCLAETVSCLQAHAIAYLNQFMPVLLTVLESGQKGQNSSDALHLLCAVTAVQKTIETLPNFLSPYITPLLIHISGLSSESEDDKSQLSMRLKACQNIVAKQVPTRVILPSVSQAYEDLHQENGASVGILMHVLSKHFSHLNKDDLLVYHSMATSFFLAALGFRSLHNELSLDAVSAVESHITQCMLTYVMKLSENTFRPMYLKLFDWATTEGAPKDRLLTFYHLSDAIADKLKSLFCLFIGAVVSNCALVLNMNNLAKTDTNFFSGVTSSEKSSALLAFLLDCLTKCFINDKGDFVTKERFELLTQPLVDQLENLIGGEEQYKKRVSNHLSPCITQLMVSMGDPGAWQPLNYQLLLKMRHDSPKVRFAALCVLEEIHDNLKENYLSLLPETIPFLAELMEDEFEEVESKCQDVVKELEKTLGEPLQKHF